MQSVNNIFTQINFNIIKITIVIDKKALNLKWKFLIYETGGHPYSLGNLKGKKMTLPESRNYFRAEDNLKWHRENVFKG